MDDKRLIEETIPLEDISRESAREKSIRHGHISTLHIWWARRPLVACRAAVFGSLVTPSKVSKETLKKTAEVTKRWLPEYKKVNITDEELVGKELYHFMRILCTWEASNNKEIIEHARLLIRESHDGKIPKVLDPFAGGGSIPLEALRLGCETYANELNPVAHIIELCTLVYPQKYGKEVEIEIEEKENSSQLGLGTGGKQVKKVNRLEKDVRKWSNWVLTEAKKEIGNVYESDSPEISPIAYIWARTIKCSNPSCRKRIPLIQSFLISDRKKGGVYLEPIENKKTDSFFFKITEKINNNQTTKKGNAICLSCHHITDVKQVRKEGLAGKISFEPLCKVIHQDKGKQYKEITIKDREIFKLASRKLRDILKTNPELYPHEQIPPAGAVAFRIPLYGIVEWGQLFNDRQLLFLITAVKKVRLAFKEIVKKEEDVKYPIFRASIPYPPLSFFDVLIGIRLAAFSVWNESVDDCNNRSSGKVLPVVLRRSQTGLGLRSPVSNVRRNSLDGRSPRERPYGSWRF